MKPCRDFEELDVRNRFRMNRCLGAAIMALSLLLALPPCSGHPGPSVIWHVGLKLGDFQASSVAAWRAALSRPWRLGDEPVSFTVGKGGDQKVVDRCDELFSAVEGGMRASGPDQATFEGWAIKCQAVRILVDGAAPQIDHVGGFALDEKGARSLPVDMAFAVSNDDVRKVASIKSAGGMLGDFLGDAKFEAVGTPGDRRAVLRDGSGGSQLLSVLAEGDFDHDGVNDLLIASNESMSGGSYHAAHLYVVSRLKAGGPLVLRKGV